MTKKIPIWPVTILLLILIAAGWFVYKSRVKPVFPAEGPMRIGPLHQQSNVTGTVLEYGSNPEGDIDKIFLATAKEKIWIHFPPHAARSIQAVAPVNSFIEATTRQGIGPARDRHDPVYELHIVYNQGNKTNIDLTHIPVPLPRKGFEVDIKGNTLKDLKIGRESANSFILSGKLISVPPHMINELSPLIRRSKTIFVKGYMRDSTEGFLSASGLPVVKANLIQLDNTTYKIR